MWLLVHMANRGFPFLSSSLLLSEDAEMTACLLERDALLNPGKTVSKPYVFSSILKVLKVLKTMRRAILPGSVSLSVSLQRLVRTGARRGVRALGI